MPSDQERASRSSMVEKTSSRGIISCIIMSYTLQFNLTLRNKLIKGSAGVKDNTARVMREERMMPSMPTKVR